MTKKEVIDSFQSNQSYIGSHVISKIKQIQVKAFDVTPLILKKGDVYTSYCGQKKRPCVVVKILKDVVVGIPLTSGENIHSSVPFNCRFFGKGFLCINCDVTDKNIATENFTGVFEDKKAMRLAIENIKEFINKL